MGGGVELGGVRGRGGVVVTTVAVGGGGCATGGVDLCDERGDGGIDGGGDGGDGRLGGLLEVKGLDMGLGLVDELGGCLVVGVALLLLW